ncbi:hypothetical protein VOLCADRAFT_121096 [Volvox carteri f. nagariensis]|uniref:Cytochrome b561 domain-containing protein n=1 Tax=Volvox carteri f. nagariensis TaxID=3068 RepID=D8U2B8_VOLCA|nr:uncharacterized protein VOLCADRAFT_121096 [Volvox carteri f. nagariensis]EFJ46106.1 hypothetical protein VOLCADRAFT_121096 [Volvox carteri f. nagariensis]|eukprot:XP_002952856.1 hypothetical protein VOLCADRAFT_121096 [Volvox carteri f. nagariensis]
MISKLPDQANCRHEWQGRLRVLMAFLFSMQRLSRDAGGAAAPDHSSQLLHIALQTDLTEYVALSWPTKGGRMSPADAVIGFQIPSSPGNYSIAAFKVTGKDASHVLPDSTVTVTNTRAEANSTALTICFTRNISQVGQGAGIRLSTQENMDMNFAASRAKFGMPHSFSRDYLCSAKVNFALPAGGPDDGQWRPSNTSSGPSDEVLQERLFYMRSHGALQFTGWIVLVPIGIFAARHRWVFAPISIVGLWFQVHRAVQMVAVMLIVTGFILPWTSFNSKDEEEVMGIDHEESMASDLLLESHMTLAIALMVIVGLHIAIAMLRPKPDTPRRWMWNLVHWWTGRGLALMAGVNVVIGIMLWRRASGGSGLEWIVPLVLLAVGWIGLALWLERRAPQGLGREGGYVCAQGGILIGYVPSPLVLSTGVSSSPGNSPISKSAATQASNGVTYTEL